MHNSGRVFSTVLLLLTSPLPSWSKESSPPEAHPKLCVALISNRTTTSLFVERMTERLTKSLVQNKLAAVAMDSATTDERELHPTLANGEELTRQECDYLVLTQVANPKNNLTEPRVPSIVIGGRTPSSDASDPMGGAIWASLSRQSGDKLRAVSSGEGFGRNEYHDRCAAFRQRVG